MEKQDYEVLIRIELESANDILGFSEVLKEIEKWRKSHIGKRLKLEVGFRK